MTDENHNAFEVPYDPATMPSSSLGTFKVIWYKRPWFLVTVVIVIVIGVSVITDLPSPITKAQDASAQNATLKQINRDIAPCTYALKETFSFYQKKVAGTLTSSNLAQVPALLIGDQSACSFTSGSVYDLTNNIQVLDTKAGKNIDKMLAVIVTWVTNDALAAIEDIQYLFVHPNNLKKLNDLTKQEAFLATDRELAITDALNASAVVGITLSAPQLPALPTLPGT